MKSSRRFRNDLAGDFAILASNSKREYIYVWDGKNWNDDPSTAKWYKTYPAMKKAFKAAGYPAGSVSVAAGTYEECVRLWDGTTPLVEPKPRTKEGFGTTFYRAPGTGQIQNPKGVKRISQKGYKFFVVGKRHGTEGLCIESGWEYREDAIDAFHEHKENDQEVKVLTDRSLKQIGLNHLDNSAWGSIYPRSPLIQAARADKQHFVFGTIANPQGDLLPGDLLIGDAQRYYGHHVPWKLDEHDLKIINRLRRAHPKLLSGTPSDTTHLNVLIDKKLWENARKPRTNPSAEYDNLMHRVDEAKQKGYNASAYVNLERRTWISENEPRAQASRFLHNMIKALNMHSWQNTAEEWQRMYDAKYTLALRGRRSRSTLSTKSKMRINPGLPSLKPDIHVMADGIVIHNLPSTVNAGDVSYYINYDTLEHPAFKNINDARVTPTGSGNTIGMMFTNEVKHFLKRERGAAIVAAYKKIAVKVVRELIAQSKTKRGIPVLKRKNPCGSKPRANGRGWSIWADKNGSRFVLEYAGHTDGYRFNTASNSAIKHKTRTEAAKFARMLKAGTISGPAEYKFVFINQSFTLPAAVALKHLMVRSPGTRDKQGTFYPVR